MPELLDTHSRAELVADAVNDILVLEGAPGITMRALASRTGVSAASLTQHLESRERIIRISAHLTARAAIAEISSRRGAERLGAHLPADECDLRAVSVWLAWAEFSRYAAFLQPVVGKWHLDEWALLRGSVVDPGVPVSATTQSATDAVFAHLCGVRVAMCRPLRPLSLADARESLGGCLALNRCRRSIA